MTPEPICVPTDAECEAALEAERAAWQARPLAEDERKSTEAAAEETAKAFGWTE
jgi:hypothetical protein